MTRPKRHRWISWGAAGVLVLQFALAAHASDESLVATARGLVEFHAARYAAALVLFEHAVERDPNDVSALYYRGVTRGRLAQWGGAAADLRRVLDQRPEHRQAALELGIALVRGGDPNGAIAPLELAAADPELAARASFFIGVAEVRRHDPRAALEHFRRAGRDPALALAARYYEGLALAQQGDKDAAAAAFVDVIQRDPTSEVGREAERYLDWLEESGRKRYRLYGSSGFEYDSNVVLAPSTDESKDVLAISDQADGRATLLAGGTWEAWHTERFSLAMGYEFFQSLHFDLTDFDVQDHRPTLQLTADFHPVQLGVVARYDYYRLGSDSLLNQATALPWIRVHEGEIGFVDVYYRMRLRDFLDDRFADRLDGVNHAVALVQHVSLGAADRYAWIGYRFDRQDHAHDAGEAFAYDGHQVEAGMRWTIPGPELGATLSYAYRHEDYDAASAGRRDHEHHVSFALERRLTKHLLARAGYTGMLNDSNQSFFEYERHIGTIALDVSF